MSDAETKQKIEQQRIYAGHAENKFVGNLAVSEAEHARRRAAFEKKLADIQRQNKIEEEKLHKQKMIQYEKSLNHNLKHYNDLCVYCGVKFDPKELTKEHLVPKFYKGFGGINIIMACRPCNSKVGSMSVREKIEYAVINRGGK